MAGTAFFTILSLGRVHRNGLLSRRPMSATLRVLRNTCLGYLVSWAINCDNVAFY